MTNRPGGRLKVILREGGKNAMKRVDRIQYLKSLRSKTKKATARAKVKV